MIYSYIPSPLSPPSNELALQINFQWMVRPIEIA